MRRGITKRIVAAVTGAVLFVQLAIVEPARANWDSYVDISIDLLVSFLDKGSDGLDPVELIQVTQELKNAITGVKVDLLAHVDALAVAEIKADARYTLNYVGFLDVPQLRGGYVNRVAAAASMAREKLAVFDSDADRDTVARAMIAEFQTLLIGTAKLNAPIPYDTYKEALTHIIATMQPHCHEFFEPRVGTTTYDCTYNGRTVNAIQRPVFNGTEVSYDGGATWTAGELNRGRVQEETMKQTGQELARRALRELLDHGH